MNKMNEDIAKRIIQHTYRDIENTELELAKINAEEKRKTRQIWKWIKIVLLVSILLMGLLTLTK